jgi:hypothetical protein
MIILVKISTKEYSQEAVQQIIEASNQEYPIPVTLGFNQKLQVGKVSSAKLVNGDIIADIEIDDVPEAHALKAE